MKTLKLFLAASFIALPLVGCNDAEPEPVPIAPLLKYIVMPSESNTIPGTDVIIEGRGFSAADEIICKSLDGEIDFTAEVVGADNYSITIKVPETACGRYQVTVRRSGLETVLNETLSVAYVIPLSNVILPSGILKQGQTCVIEADGVEAGDKIRLESPSYPYGSVTVDCDCSDGRISFSIPSACYAVNNLTLVRGKRVGNLGEIKIGVDLLAKTAGGIVFYTSDNGVHGLVVNTSAVGEAAMNWGPAIPNNFAVGSSLDIYAGKTNSTKILAKENEARNSYAYSHKTPVELCEELTSQMDGLTYDDWFLPSVNELIELFKVKASVAEAGFSIPANNYWTSSEYDYSGGWLWAMYYVNFYEAVNIVYNGADRTGWSIGTLAVRQF